MKVIQDEQHDEDRALYGLDGIQVLNCKFDGPADGESAMKEADNKPDAIGDFRCS